jgi:hypothetical protein
MTILIQKEKKSKVKRDRYELTLAEFPIFLLSKKVSKDLKYIEYEDTIKGRNGEIVPRKWRVYPHAELGFPGPTAFQTFYDLMQIWKEQGFESQYILFGSKYNFLKRQKKSDSKVEYNRLDRDLDRLTGILIKAENAFWDNEVEAYVDLTFHLFEKVEIYKEKFNSPQGILPFSKIKASDELYGSILKNSVMLTDFDSDFFRSLKPTTKRLVLYLTKVFRSQPVHRKDLMKFAKQLPIYAKDKKKIRQRIRLSCQELQEKGFKKLSSYEFEKTVNGQENIVFTRVLGRKTLKEYKKTKEDKQIKQAEIEILIQDILEVCKDEKSVNFYRQVAKKLDRQTIYRAIAEVKEVRDLGEVKRNLGATFTYLVKKYAKEQNIEI